MNFRQFLETIETPPHMPHVFIHEYRQKFENIINKLQQGPDGLDDLNYSDDPNNFYNNAKENLSNRNFQIIDDHRYYLYRIFKETKNVLMNLHFDILNPVQQF